MSCLQKQDLSFHIHFQFIEKTLNFFWINNFMSCFFSIYVFLIRSNVMIDKREVERRKCNKKFNIIAISQKKKNIINYLIKIENNKIIYFKIAPNGQLAIKEHACCCPDSVGGNPLHVFRMQLALAL